MFDQDRQLLRYIGVGLVVIGVSVLALSLATGIRDAAAAGAGGLLTAAGLFMLIEA